MDLSIDYYSKKSTAAQQQPEIRERPVTSTAQARHTHSINFGHVQWGTPHTFCYTRRFFWWRPTECSARPLVRFLAPAIIYLWDCGGDGCGRIGHGNLHTHRRLRRGAQLRVHRQQVCTVHAQCPSLCAPPLLLLSRWAHPLD